jgi:pimeloyl-ACP methyl ester carboxylesterase
VELRTSEVAAAGCRLYAVHLEPPNARGAVVVIHGMVVAGRGTLPLARALAERGLAVHLPDLVGFGRSDKTRHAFDVGGLARTTAAWMRELDLEGSVVLGNSFGTQVAAALVEEEPDLACALVLLSPTIDKRFRGVWTRVLPAGRPGGSVERGWRGSFKQHLAHLLIPAVGADDSPTLRSLLVREYVAASLLRALSTYRHALRDDIDARMPKIGVPVLVLRTGEDNVVSPAWAQRLAATAPTGRFAVVPGTDHDSQFERPDRLADAAIEGLRALGMVF